VDGSLVRTIERLRRPGRTLDEGLRDPPAWLLEAVPDRLVVDPERPLAFEAWMSESVPHRLRTEAEVNLRLIGMLALACAAATATWIGSSAAEEWGALVPSFGAPTAWVLLSCFVLATLIPIPTTLLTVVAVLGFGLTAGMALAGLGLSLNATAGYLIGQRVDRDTVRRLAGSRLNRISRRLARRGVLAVTALRLLPVTPFALVGLVAGASRVRVGDYAIGTLVGTIPSLVMIAVLVDRFGAVVRDPNPSNAALAAGLFVLTGIAALLAARGLNARPRAPTKRG
jgi:uncharacterized membrane protein YdjX (TVP38/TMEM64 family)